MDGPRHLPDCHQRDEKLLGVVGLCVAVMTATLSLAHPQADEMAHSELELELIADTLFGRIPQCGKIHGLPCLVGSNPAVAP